MKEPQSSPTDISVSTSISSAQPRQIPVRFLVIGAGSRGNAYAGAVTKATTGIIHAVAEPHSFKRRDFGQNYIWGAEGSPSEGQEFADWREWVQWETERRRRRRECIAGKTESASSTESDQSGISVGVDGVFICTLDETHVEIIKAIAPLNLHILCEKPLALSLSDCLTVYRTLQPPTSPTNPKPKPPTTIFSIGHVLRYSPHNILLRRLLVSEHVIGEIISLEHTEPVGWWHFSHSYVRGNWRRATKAGDGSLLTKSCHDIDFILWLLCSPECAENAHMRGHQPHLPRTISSTGTLTQFRSTRKPASAGSATNCLSCAAEQSCLYSAPRIYNTTHLAKGHTRWPVDIVCPDIEDIHRTQGAAAAETHLLSKLAEDYDKSTTQDSTIASKPWYGRCVYESDNNVVDDQIVTITWSDAENPPHNPAKTATFHMIAPTEKQCERRGRVYGTKGEISYDSHTISIYDFGSGETRTIQVPPPPPDQIESHGGGDYGLARQFVAAVEAVVHGGVEVETAQARFVGCTLEEAVRSHAVVFAAEEARREERVVRWKEWWEGKLRVNTL